MLVQAIHTYANTSISLPIRSGEVPDADTSSNLWENGMSKCWKEKPALANALTIARIVLSLALLLPAALSPAFLTIYAIAGVTDMLDGFVARRTNTASDFGAMLDSIADLVFATVSLVRILSTITVPIWLWVWVALIALVKVVNVASGYVVERRLVMPHTIANKAAGLVVYLVPFALPYVGVVTSAIPACAVATFSAIQEGYLIRTGRA